MTNFGFGRIVMRGRRKTRKGAGRPSEADIGFHFGKLGKKKDRGTQVEGTIGESMMSQCGGRREGGGHS